MLFPYSPTQAEWDAMSSRERSRYLDSIPGDPPPVDVAPPEGMAHWSLTRSVYDTLHHHFRLRPRKVFLACNLRVLYPGEPDFAPVLMAVFDMEKNEQERAQLNAWMVVQEGKGLDLALEIHVRGNKRKDVSTNVERYARLGIREYFVLDWPTRRLLGWRLDATKGAYRALVPQLGRFDSEVLDLQLGLVERRLRFFSGATQLVDGDGLVDRLEAMVTSLYETMERESLELEAERAKAEEEKARAEEEKARAEEEKARAEAAERRAAEEGRRAQEAERRLAEVVAELERLKQSKG